VPGTILRVEIVATATIWVMFGCFLVFPLFGLPAVFHRTAMLLLAAELVALAMWSYGSPGDPGSEVGWSAAAIDIPLLALALVVLAALFGARRRAVIYFRRHEDSRHGLPRQGRLRDRDRAG
jgi:hypothetical protein